jgi:uncharacterized glyoxalase superfamily metalloenzyme YdcJ
VHGSAEEIARARRVLAAAGMAGATDLSSAGTP